MAAMKIVWAANNYWDSPFQVGCNSLAREFAAMGMEIAFLSDPISPFHLLASGSKDTFWGRWSTWRAGGKYDLGGKLFYYSPFAPLVPANKPLLRSRAVLDHWHRLTLPSVTRKVRQAGFGEVDLLIVDTTSQHFWFDAIRHRRSVVRVTDFAGGFQKSTPALLSRESDMIRRADVVTYTARNLRGMVEEAGARKAVYTPNGINVQHLTRGDRSEPTDMAPMPRPRVIYVGALEEWFDTGLVRRCALENPGASFVIIGPSRTDLSALRDIPNIHLLGARSHSEVARYLWNSDVGIIPFRTSHPVIKSVHPIKLYEYIACELPVVSTRWEELDEIPLEFHKADNHAGFLSGLRAALGRGRHPQNLEQFSWRSTAERILQAVSPL